MSRKAIEYLIEYRITQSDWEALSADEQAVLGVLSYAVSESNVLRRLYIFSSHKMQGDVAIDSAISIQRFVLLRAASSKLFEVAEFLRLGGKKKETKDSEILELSERALSNFSLISAGEGYQVARDVRHEATHHYSFRAAKKNLGYLSSRANRSLYLHEKNGNSFFPLGEELLFVSRISRTGSDLTDKDAKEELFRKWFDWNIAASKWLDETHASFVRELIFKRHPERRATRKAYWIDPELVGAPETAKVPIFFRNTVI